MHADPSNEETASVVADRHSVVDGPIEFAGDGPELTLVGDAGVIRDRHGVVPDSARATVERTGDDAGAVGCSATTVGEHLRTIGRRLVREIAPVEA